MALNFTPPPDWLISNYLNQKHPAEAANEGIGNAIKAYVAMRQTDQQNRLDQRKADMAEQDFALRNKELEFKGKEHFYNYGDPSGLSPEMQSGMQNPAQGPIAESGEGPKKSPVLSYFSQFMETYPQGIKGREKQDQNNFQQAPVLADGKPLRWNPKAGQYEIAQVVDPSQPGQTVQNPEFTPRVPTQPSYQVLGTQDGRPVLLNPKTKQTEFATLPGEGPLTSTTQTEGQANAKLYADRMDLADQQINDLSTKTDLTSTWSAVQGKGPNVAKSQNIQMFEQAKRNFLNAVLRRESGAVISPTEFAEGDKQYFPVFGDSPEVLKQKALNRQTAREGLRNAAGGAPSTQTQASSSPPQTVPVAAFPDANEEALYQAYKASQRGKS